MSKGFKTGGFERRLLVFFLLISVTPTLLIAIFGTSYFAGYIERLSNVALKQSFQNSMDIAREYSSRLDADAATMARRSLTDFRRQQSRPGTGMNDWLEIVADRNDAHFVGLYVLGDSGWRLAGSYPASITRLDTLLNEETISPDPGPHRAAFSDRDIIASSIKLSPDSSLVSGYLLSLGRMETMRRTGEDYSRYSSIGLYVNTIRRYSLFIIGALVILMIVASAMASRLIARRISYPIRELADATDRIARGDLDHRVEVKARDEIQSLVTSFNNMTRDLQEYKKNLVRAERIAAWRDVARRIAHDIKNPLTPMTLAIYRLKKRLAPEGEAAGAGRPAGGSVVGVSADGGPDCDCRDEKDTRVVEECLDSILKEVEVLKNLAQEFSSFAKMPEPTLKPTDLNETVRSILDLYVPTFEGLDLVTSYGEGLPYVEADPDQIRRVIGNIVKNAAEAMEGKGRLAVATSQSGGMVRVEIADTGPGIPEEMKERIFDPYYTTKKHGTGLGLAMAYRIIQDHGGKISMETGPDGTTFFVDLRSSAMTGGI
jgi:nitrogen fixation/metabolism regulation signal transduction histidine kinase